MNVTRPPEPHVVSASRIAGTSSISEEPPGLTSHWVLALPFFAWSDRAMDGIMREARRRNLDTRSARSEFLSEEAVSRIDLV